MPILNIQHINEHILWALVFWALCGTSFRLILGCCFWWKPWWAWIKTGDNNVHQKQFVFCEELPQPIWARVPTPLLGNSKKANFPNLGFPNFGSLCGECCGSCWCGNVFWAWLNRTTKVLYLSECPTIASYWSITFVFFLKDGFARVPECLSVSLKSCKYIDVQMW